MSWWDALKEMPKRLREEELTNLRAALRVGLAAGCGRPEQERINLRPTARLEQDAFGPAAVCCCCTAHYRVWCIYRPTVSIIDANSASCVEDIVGVANVCVAS